MSKSLGNGIDPLVVVEKFGPTRCAGPAWPTPRWARNLLLDPNDLETTFAPGRNFANKLELAQFVLKQTNR